MITKTKDLKKQRIDRAAYYIDVDKSYGMWQAILIKDKCDKTAHPLSVRNATQLYKDLKKILQDE